MSGNGHSPFGGSAAHRWIPCGPSIQFFDPNESAGEAAEEGTDAHALAEHCLREGIHDLSDVVGMTLDARVGRIPISEEMAMHVQGFVNLVHAHLHPDDDFRVEEKVGLYHVAADLTGTADVTIYKAHTKDLHVFDLKYGAGIWVDVNANPQLMFYALGVLVRLRNDPVSRVTIHIYQPRNASGGAHRSWSISPRDLWAWGEDVLRPAYERAKRGTAEYVPGDAQCKWCGGAKPGPAGLPKCKAFAREAAASVVRDFERFTGGGVLTIEDNAPPAEMPPAVLGMRLRQAALLERWIKNLREYAEAEARAGRVPGSYKLVDSVGHRKWANEAQAATIFETLFPTEDLWTAPELKSPAQMEKALGPVASGVIETLMTRPRSVLLVPQEDNRQGVAEKTAEMFPIFEG